MKTCIIIPTLRERENLISLIPLIFKHVPDATILIADDHSQDGTKELSGELVVVLDRVTDHGYGKAILDGFRWAFERGYDQVVTMDADFSHDPCAVPELLNNLSTSDVVIGSRYVDGGTIKNWSLHRRFLSQFANSYVRMILHTGVADNTTGFVAYRRGAVEYILAYPPHSEGYAFLVEVKYLLKLFSTSEYPIMYIERREGQSKMSWNIIWESIWLPWRLRFARLKQ